MKCLICRREFYPKRTLRTLFVEEPVFKCYGCDRKYDIHPRVSVLPIQNYQLYLISLNLDEKVSDLAFLHEMNVILEDLLRKTKKTDTILWIDEFTEALYQELEKLDYGNIYVISVRQPIFLV